ncbi:hypothetical protein CP966_00015 [Streptomyces galilaeus]|uniref:hypothetical protein n=1 Tax=Streptomyces galilaeus TaxID=33899 RepID=UPI0012A2F641|nr:hypothetical protein [Streptomyces galilaeus]QEU63838.1 hypothetical protein CP966_00015 [Streptomyces galilaeus]
MGSTTDAFTALRTPDRDPAYDGGGNTPDDRTTRQVAVRRGRGTRHASPWRRLPMPKEIVRMSHG